MRRTTTWATMAGVTVAASISLCSCAATGGAKRDAAGESNAATTTPQKALRHVVLFRFKDDASPEQIRAVEEAFVALPSKIPGIKGLEWGTNVSPEGLAQGYTHCFFLTFASEADRDAYLPHPAHKEFGAILHPILDKVLVVDYWARS